MGGLMGASFKYLINKSLNYHWSVRPMQYVTYFLGSLLLTHSVRNRNVIRGLVKKMRNGETTRHS